MKTHRVRATPAPNGEPDYVWLEIEPDSWVEIGQYPSHAQIERTLELEKAKRGGIIRYASRAFEIGLIKGPIKELARIYSPDES